MSLKRRRFTCPIKGCSYASPSLYGIKLHLKYGHNIRGLKTCPLCGKTFKSPRSLRNHASHMPDIVHMVIWWTLRGCRYGAKAWKARKKELFEALRRGEVKIPWPQIF
jgi:hypothetical protein